MSVIRTLWLIIGVSTPFGRPPHADALSVPLARPDANPLATAEPVAVCTMRQHRPGLGHSIRREVGCQATTTPFPGRPIPPS